MESCEISLKGTEKSGKYSECCHIIGKCYESNELLKCICYGTSGYQFCFQS